MNKAKPFIKWAGGKGRLITQLERLFPSSLGSGGRFTYVEPFVGGGSMLFHMLEKYENIDRAVINDRNSDLVRTYLTVRDNPEDLVEILHSYQDEYGRLKSVEERKELYLAKRDLYNRHSSSDVETAALFIFLNKTCFNGLYRVNSSGDYNVPFGKSENPLICDSETILADSKLLGNVEIVNGDFENIHSLLGEKSFVYMDPPYRPLPGTASFTSYQKGGFNDEEQKRLASFCRMLDSEGHMWMQSNSDPANKDSGDRFFEEVYEGFEIGRISASRMINSKKDGRGPITELVVRNYK